MQTLDVGVPQPLPSEDKPFLACLRPFFVGKKPIMSTRDKVPLSDDTTVFQEKSKRAVGMLIAKNLAWVCTVLLASFGWFKQQGRYEEILAQQKVEAARFQADTRDSLTDVRQNMKELAEKGSAPTVQLRWEMEEVKRRHASLDAKVDRQEQILVEMRADLRLVVDYVRRQQRSTGSAQ